MANFERDIHRIEDDIRENWIEEWADEGIDDAEAFLAKHQMFAVESIVKAKQIRDVEELASWGLSEDDVLGWGSQQLAA